MKRDPPVPAVLQESCMQSIVPSTATHASGTLFFVFGNDICCIDNDKKYKFIHETTKSSPSTLLSVQELGYGQTCTREYNFLQYDGPYLCVKFFFLLIHSTKRIYGNGNGDIRVCEWIRGFQVFLLHKLVRVHRNDRSCGWKGNTTAIHNAAAMRSEAEQDGRSPLGE